jgi:hypothetical protein
MPTNIITSPANLGQLSTLPITIGGTVSTTAPSDFFRFTLGSLSDVNLSLTGLTADADIRIIRDVNNNGIVDAGDVIVTSGNGGTANDSINLNNQAAGTYFAQIYQFTGNTGYTLRLSSGTSTNNLIASEENIGALSTMPVLRSGYVGDTDTSDIYGFQLTGLSDINVALTGLSADADVRIIRDANNNGIIDATDAIAFSSNGGTRSDAINLNNQAAGNYFAQVYQYTGNTSYTLQLSNAARNNLIAAEENLGALSAAPFVRNGSVGDTDTSDIYGFQLTSAGDINVALTGLSADADVRVIRDANNNGVVDATDVVAYSSNGGSRNDAINLNNQAAGNYFAEVYQFAGTTNYNLKLSNAYNNNLIAAEENLGALSNTPVVRGGYIDSTDASDVYAFQITNASDINISLTGLSADADVRIIRDANNNGVSDAGDVVVTSSNGGSTNDSINLNDQAAGNYFAEVYQFAGNTSYSLKLSNAGISNLVAPEETIAVGFGANVNRFGNVNSSDTSDIYKFSLSGATYATAKISGLSADADLRIIRDTNSNGIVDTGEVIGSSTRSGTAIDTVSGFLGAGDYLVQVYQYANSSANYTLNVTTL